MEKLTTRLRLTEKGWEPLPGESADPDAIVLNVTPLTQRGDKWELLSGFTFRQIKECSWLRRE